MTKRKVNAYTIKAQRIVEIVKELKALPYKPNLKQVSDDWKCDYDKLWRAYQGYNSRSTRRAPNRRLDNAEELALKQFLNYVDSIRFGIQKEIVRNAANLILA
ncbi:hypothetical protein V2W45_760738 [Cenococcum geophilum]